MLGATAYPIKFDQANIIDYYKDTHKNIFTRKIVGVNNVNSFKKGICYGLTNAFLYYAHAGQEETYITETYKAYKNITQKNPLYYLRPSYYKSLKKHSKAVLNQNFNKAYNIQKHYQIAYFINNIISEFNRSRKHSHESVHEYINRLFKINISSVKEDEAEAYFELYEFTNKLYQDTLNPTDDKVDNNKYYQLVKNVQDFCFNERNEIDTGLFFMFFSLIKNYYLDLTKNRFMQAENLNSINYDSIELIDDNIKFTSKSLKKHIDHSLENKKNIIGNMSSNTHSMGIVVKYNNGNPLFEFFEPNEGLFKTTNKQHFFKFLDKFFHNKSYSFMTLDGENAVSLSSSLVADKTFDDIQAPRVEKSLIAN
ncbi:hypothetical protein ABN056_16860 [Providencia vermicola]|uniref:hypothetical protein n=1 Tax=Providencia TaxID=586 RepID=UPI002349F3D4|nr:MULTISPECIES: hypothetical protein [unclassified Providencia]